MRNKTMSLKNITLLAAVLILLTACAHPIVITPDSSKLSAIPETQRSLKIVGYFVSDEERAKKNITGGGGGDKVEHSTSRDLEAGIYRVFNNVFKDVFQLKSMTDSSFITSKGITLLLRPIIGANSSSDSILTWPPTAFEVTIQITAYDLAGKEIWKTSASGKGNATFSEFAGNFGLAGKRASENALIDLQEKLLGSPLLK
jgi:hypothetical protein